MRGLLCVALLGAGCFDFEALSSGDIDASAQPDLPADDLANAAASDFAAVDLREPVSCPVDALTCESFESVDLGSAWVTSASSSSSAMVSLTGGFSGPGFLSTQSTGGVNSYAYVEYQPSHVIASGTVHIRAWLRGPSASGYPLFGIVGGSYPLAFGVNKANKWFLSLNGGNQDVASTVSFAPDAWSCALFDVDLDDGTVSLAINGSPAASAVSSAGPPGPLAFVHLGLARAAPTETSAVEVDDVAVSMSPLGCL